LKIDWRETGKNLVVVLAIVGMVRGIIRPYRVTGDSMTPALADGQYVVAERISYLFREPRPGEVVLINTPPHGRKLIKRVHNVQSDGAVWVVGDNYEESQDSRVFGAVPRRLIVGRAAWVYWPPANWGPVDAWDATAFGRGLMP